MDQTLYQRLRPVIRRMQFRRVAVTLAVVWIGAALIAAWMFYLNRNGDFDPSGVLLWLAGGTLVASVVGAIFAAVKTKTVEQVSADIERQYPDLDASLITAMEQRPIEGEHLGFLQQDVLRKAVTHSYVHSWTSLIPVWQLVAAPLAGLFGLIAFAAAMICLVLFTKPIPPDPTIAFADAAADATNFEISVEPGNAEVERGTSLLVLARFAESIPPEASLVFNNSDGIESRLPMSKSLDDPVFGARISSVSQPLSYRVEFAEQQTDTYEVSVFEFPKLVRADVTLKFPAYTEVEDKTVQDFRRINAVEGTTATLTFFVNKPVADAVLTPREGDDEPIELVVEPNDPKKLTAQIRMDQSRKYELNLRDDATRENRSPPKFVLNVLENKPPDLKLVAPGRDIDASPIEEVQLSANAWDDFGLKSFGLNYGIPGRENKDVILEQKPINSKKPAVKKRTQVDHLLALEELKAQPDELVSYYFWAEDIGPDGELRRVSSDMYFAEVRHFDEIYRQGQAPPAGQQQQQQQQQAGENAQQAQKLGELQKEIINGTWKMIRREKKGSPSEKFGADSELLAESQTAAIELLAELAEKLEDPQSKSYVESIRTFMNEAVLHLTQANHDGDVPALKPALSSEQAAYQGLLKLRAREHEIVRQQQQQAGKGQQQNNRSQQQLDQLNLKEDENRYENEKTAQQQTEQTQQQQEDRQVLSRLRELARRQDDLNQRVKELQSALEEAKTEEEREEIERRLKSLREQQERMLRDTDELLDRMQGEQNQQRMAEEAEQLEQTRENLQRASEALDKNEASRAAAEGTRAQRDLEELRDEFQNRTAGQFTEEMRQMRNQAQELERKQQEISEQLSDQPKIEKKKTPSLRETEDEKPDLRNQLADQQQAVENLRDQMRETIEEAEPFEPLLAEELYDTYRDSEVSRPDEALQSVRRSLDRGWVDDARTEEERARQGIEEMREGIERAAENVLGDETEALKAAQDTLRDLNRQLQEEIKQRDRSEAGEAGNAEGNRQGQSRTGEPRDGKRTDGEQERQPGQGQGQPGEQEQQEGQQPEGERQQGQGQQGQPSEDKPGEQQEGQQGQQGQGQPNQEPPEGQQGQGQGQQPGQQPGEQPQDGQGGGSPQGRNDRGDRQDREAQSRMRQQMRELGSNEPNEENRGGPNQNAGGGNRRMMQPISGEDFREWSDRLRDVEEMVADPDLRAEASRIREQAREIRKEMKERHSAEPNWDLVKLKVAKPLAELQDRVAEEIMRRGSQESLVPLDRDPVPAEYQDAVRRYYERLGSGQ